MCEIATTIDRDRDLTVRTVVGEVTTQELLAAMASYFATGPTRFVLWEFSGATLDRLTVGEVRTLAQATGRYVAGRADGAGLLLGVRVRDGEGVRPAAEREQLTGGVHVVPRAGGGAGVARGGVGPAPLHVT